MVFLVKKQPDEAPGADAADTHNLQSEVLQVVAVQEDTTLIGERLAIIDECLANPFLEARIIDVIEKRRLIDQAAASSHFADNLGKEVFDNTLAGFVC